MSNLLFSNAAAIVLAGGKSTRMGGPDKSMLDVNGQPMIQYITAQLKPLFGAVFVGSSDVAKYSFLGLPVVPDKTPGMGPLMGIASCLEASPFDVNFITACDIPVMNAEFIGRLIEAAADADIVIPVRDDGRYEPLYAVYRRGVAGKAEALLGAGEYKISELFSLVNTKYIPFPWGDWYHNINYRDDYLRFTGNG
ncbi:MAG: molybdenum cofactor guanylyltransferase [Bacteroidetes bacterium]|nr:molybdenum cofactor guanylyltransferase [Bacteroidota bacterium]